MAIFNSYVSHYQRVNHPEYSGESPAEQRPVHGLPTEIVDAGRAAGDAGLGGLTSTRRPAAKVFGAAETIAKLDVYDIDVYGCLWMFMDVYGCL